MTSRHGNVTLTTERCGHLIRWHIAYRPHKGVKKFASGVYSGYTNRQSDCMIHLKRIYPAMVQRWKENEQ